MNNKYFFKSGELVKKTSKEINIEGKCAHCYENDYKAWNKDTEQWECRRCFPVELEKLLFERSQWKNADNQVINSSR